jgi:hemerythrin-like domain-containing protein
MEHQVILRVIGVLERLVERSERGDGFEAESLGRCVEFSRLFADACHHAKEEDLLFPVLESRGIPRDGGPIGVMLQEHQMARAYTRQMGEALEAAQGGEADAAQRFHEAAHQYIELLTMHIGKEDNILYPMGDRVMTTDDQDTLRGRFCEVGCRAFGGKHREELERIADELEAQWPAT